MADRGGGRADAVWRGVPRVAAVAGGPDDLAGVGVPTLSLLHREDRWAGFAETHELLRARVPGCQAATAELDSHLLQIADPRAVAGAGRPVAVQPRPALTPSRSSAHRQTVRAEPGQPATGGGRAAASRPAALAPGQAAKPG